MGKSKKTKKLLVSFLILFFLVSVPQFVFAYGEGGEGAGGTGGDPLIQQTKIYTREELEKIFIGLPKGLRNLVIDKQVGKERTQAQLIKIRRLFLEAELFKNQAESIDANAWANFVGYYTEMAIFLDKRGKDAEFILSFMPGVGKISSSTFGTVRAGISKYSEGKGIGDIAQAMALSVAVDQVMKLGSLKKFNKRSDELTAFIADAKKLERNPAVEKYLRMMHKEYVKTAIEGKLTKEIVGKTIEAIAKEIQNKNVPTDRPPVFIMPSWGPEPPGPEPGLHFM